MMKLITNEPYLITWQDTISDSGWFSLEQVIKNGKMKPITSIGYYVAKTKDFLIICRDFHDYFSDEEYGDPSYIPLGSIISIKKIKVI